MKIIEIKNEKDYKEAMRQIEKLFDPAPGSGEERELIRISDLVEKYEDEHFPMGMPDPVSAIKFRMEQAGLEQRDLISYIGSRAQVSQVLSGKRPLSLQMIRSLHKHLGIPAEVLLQDPLSPEASETNWKKFPLKAMAKMGWIADAAKERAAETVRAMIDAAGGPKAIPEALFRKNDGVRKNAQVDVYALDAWCLQVLGEARKIKCVAQFKPGTVNPEFLRLVATYSLLDKGPAIVRDLLAKYGIRLVVVPHLPRTHLDGAAMMLPDRSPVIALTLRYDRLDNFWFCLLHELAHVGRHMTDVETPEIFVDDINVRESARARQEGVEREADEWAEESLISKDVWRKHGENIIAKPTFAKVKDFATNICRIHPAIVAGRIRRETKNYKLFSTLIGIGEVRQHFKETFRERGGSD